MLIFVCVLNEEEEEVKWGCIVSGLVILVCPFYMNSTSWNCVTLQSPRTLCNCHECTFRMKIMITKSNSSSRKRIKCTLVWSLVSIILIFDYILGRKSVGWNLSTSTSSIVFLEGILNSLWWFLGHSKFRSNNANASNFRDPDL